MENVGITVVMIDIPKNVSGLVQVLVAEEILFASIFMLLLLVMMITATNVKDAKVCLKKKNM